MKVPDIFLVVRIDGDGYGHNSYEYMAWFFDEDEANSYADSARGAGRICFDVERVPAGAIAL